MVFQLAGAILKGGFTLVRMKGGGEKNWLLIKKRDEHGRGDWKLEPALTAARKKKLRAKAPPCEVHS
jgi:hypothetical protein